MVEFVKGKSLQGPVVAIIGAVLLIIGGLIATIINLPYIALIFVMPIILGILGILSVFLAMTGNDKGNYLVIFIGLIAMIGMFIPMYNAFSLVISFIYIDPFLILIGGILGIILKE